MTTFMRCPRKWHLSYLQGYKSPETSSALKVGTLVHAGLEAHYKGEDLTEWIHWRITAEQDEDGMLPAESQLAYLMLEGYLEWLEETGIDADLRPEYIERAVEVELMPGVNLHGTIDWTARDPYGGLWLFDHKTTDTFGALANRRLQLSFQLLTYAWLLWQTTGEVPAGVALNMLRKVKRTAAAKPPFYAREFVHFNQHQLEAHGDHMRQVVAMMAEAKQKGAFYPVPDQDCTWKCPFLSVCAMADDGSDLSGALNELYVRSNVNGR